MIKPESGKNDQIARRNSQHTRRDRPDRARSLSNRDAGKLAVKSNDKKVIRRLHEKQPASNDD
jgi:hypothetical protein